jgi:hypothetical protein
MLLRQPRLRIIYVTSGWVAPAILDYYLSLVPGVEPGQARARLAMVAVNDCSPRSLTEKLLDRPRLLRRIAALIPDPSRCHLVPFVTTPLERDLALALDIPVYGADPRLAGFGTKSGCRRLFAAVGVRHPVGCENLYSLPDLLEATVRLRAARPDLAQAIVKLNEGVAGEGNATVDLAGLPAPGSPGEQEQIAGRLRRMRFEQADTPFDRYVAKLAQRGGVIEERITGVQVRSPSVQLRITPTGEVQLLSTHDQLLGGPSGQSYHGCRFPAERRYARAISVEAARIGARLAGEGVLGRFAVDFVVVNDGGENWTPYAIELNLRKGGTTHPFLALQMLTNGRYDAATAVFRTPAGAEKHLVATDHFQSPVLRGLTVDDLFEITARRRLRFDHVRQGGVVVHMVSCLTEHGRLGLTAIGDTPAQAGETYQRARRILLREAQRSLEETILAA